jgi:lysophospholipase L1-like esterase
MPYLAAALIGLAVLTFIFLGLTIPLIAEPSNSPKAFLKRGRKKSTKTLVVCAGDSITHGVVSANYLTMLQKKYAKHGYEFVNAGINGNLAWNVLQRLDEIIACKPDVVTLLIGTNDVNATLNEISEENYRRQQKLTEKPTFDTYRQNIETIIERLKTETSAKIAIIGLPMLGENLDSELNQRINHYDEALQAIAAEKGVTYLPLPERLLAMLPHNYNPPAYKGQLDTILYATLKHHFLRQSWDSISRQNGFAILTDHIHLNDKAAGEVANLVGEFIKSEG